jgi:hypothetical protein
MYIRYSTSLILLYFDTCGNQLLLLLKLSQLRAEHPMLTLIELIYVKKKHEKLTLACKGDTLPALLVWFHHNLAGFSNSDNDFSCFLSVITRYYDGPYTLLETG